jgi:nucleotide-binding universal stress UspA family protein
MAEIVVGVDGSDQSTAALRWALGEAAAKDQEVVALLAWDLFTQFHVDGSRRFDPDYDAADADAALAALVETAAGPEAAGRVTRRVVNDLPVPALLDASEGAALVVVGARGLGGFRGMLLGSVSQQVLHHARVPLAVVRTTDDHGDGDGDDRPEPGRVIVGVDGSPSSAAALDWAIAAGAARGAVVEVIHAWEPPLLYRPVAGVAGYEVAAVEDAGERLLREMVERATEAAGAAPSAVERTVATGGAASSLLDAAKAADVLVVGRRGHGGFGRLLLGSVSDHVARHAPCPVVVVPAPEADETQQAEG